VGKIIQPFFQSVQARDRFTFTTLTPVDCALCRQSTDTTRLFCEGRFPIVRCQRCGLIYAAVQPSAAELQDYYTAFFSGAAQSDPSFWDHRYSFKQAASLLEVAIPAEKRQGLLEIGAGYGFMISRVLAQGWSDIVALEPDLALAEGLKKKFPYVELRSQPLEECDFPDKSFQAILMLASLEHFKQPAQVLEFCRDKLKPGGVIIIRVPWYELFFTINHLLHLDLVKFGVPRHLYDFSPTTLSGLLRRCGYDVRAILPGAAERSTSRLASVIAHIIKGTTFSVWHLSGKRYILPLSGSIVAVASPWSGND